MNLHGNVPPIIIKIFEQIVNYINNAKLKDSDATIKGNVIIQDIYQEMEDQEDTYMCILASSNPKELIIFNTDEYSHSHCLNRRYAVEAIDHLGSLRKYISYYNISMDYISIDCIKEIYVLNSEVIEKEYGDILADL